CTGNEYRTCAQPKLSVKCLMHLIFEKKKTQEFLSARLRRRISKIQSNFGFFFFFRLLFFFLFFLELLGRKNSLCLFEECSAAFLCAASLHALGLPRFDFTLLIWSEIQGCQINACRFLSV